MKRLLMALTFVLCLTGCEKILSAGGGEEQIDDILIIDWAAIHFNIQVVDANGKDLLDPSNDNSWLLGTTISFMGKKDIIGQGCLDSTYKVKAYLPHFDGIKLMRSESASPNWFLKFAEFDGADSYDNEKMTLTWPDGKSNIVTYSRKFNQSHTEVAEEVYKLDGVKCSNPIKIVR